MPRLVIEKSGQEQQVFELPPDRPVHVGRAETNDLVLRETSVSRQHAVLSPGPNGSWQLTDLGSANGVVLNGHVVREASLKNNDLLSIGSYSVRFESLESHLLLTHAASMPARLTMVMSMKDVSAALQIAESVQPPPSAAGAISRATISPAPAPGDSADLGEMTNATAVAGQRLKALEHENRLLSLLYQVSRALAELVSIEEVVKQVLDLALQVEGVERGYAMLLDGKGGFLPAVIRYRDSNPATHGTQMILSQSIIQRVLQGGVPLLVRDARSDSLLGSSRSIALSGMQSAMCAPLRSGAQVYGLLYVDNLVKRGMFSQEDLNVFSVIAAQAGLSIDRVSTRQEVARQIIQRNALERFLSPGIAKKIASEAANIELRGESQKVTVLFSDIRDFTSMAETMTSEQTVEILNDYFSAMTERIFEREGTLDKFLGDGLMCLFGAPFSTGHDAINAVRTAIDMQHTLVQLNRDFQRPLRMGIGINSGPAVVGYIGASRRMDYTAIGDVVNVASRLTARAAPDQILISAATFEELGGVLPVRMLEPIRVKGKSAPIAVYEVIWQECPPPSPPSTK
ncbi:MAG: FHA domain-containing protein [Acidipila sp.]|nr:FHA domain-containing protein [Acidipila sp.]